MSPKGMVAALWAEGAWRDMLISMGLAVALAAGFHATVAEARFIPSGSMQPTLAIGDRVVIEKLSYRWARPRRGDIVVFKPPSAVIAFGYDDQVPWIKRVIGLPGDRVRVTGGRVYLNGHALTEPYVEEAPVYAMAERAVPEACVWVMGDNRNHSIDSHIWGPLPLDHVIGRAGWRFWPPAHAGGLAGVTGRHG